MSPITDRRIRLQLSSAALVPMDQTYHRDDQPFQDALILSSRLEFMSHFAVARECWFWTIWLPFCYVCGQASGGSWHPQQSIQSDPSVTAGRTGKSGP
jgi:hypothetical protein